MLSADKPYNELPLLPPKIKLTAIIFSKVVAAHRALAELKGLAESIPDQTIILNSLILKEAKDSSGIENIITTQDELYKAFSAEKVEDPAIKEILMYKEALWGGYELLKKRKLITTREIIKIQEVLIGNNAGIRKQPGTALKNAKTGETIYTPPYGPGVIDEKMKNLEEFINTDNDEIDPLIKMAIIHYQFESIHPFYDGNGRAGRILNVLYLIHKELLDLPILYMSSYILKHKKKYYDGLTFVRIEKNWEDWILYMLESIESTAKDTAKTIRGIKVLLNKTVEKVKVELPKIYSKELVEVLFHQPYTKIGHLVDNKIVTRFAASKYLKMLEEIGILKGEKTGREMLYINVELYKLLKE